MPAPKNEKNLHLESFAKLLLTGAGFYFVKF